MGAPKLASQHSNAAPADHDDHDEGDGLPHAAKKGEEGEGPWLVSYADLMTLLMGFFALVASSASLDKGKYEQAAESASQALGGIYQAPYEDLSSSLKKFLAENGLLNQVEVNRSLKGVQLTFSGTLFFDSGEFIIREEGRELMQKLAEKIKGEPKKYKALIEGHTDSVPISHSIIASNWELSGLRAARIAQVFEGAGFTKDQLTIIGWGETKPLVPETEDNAKSVSEARAKNRRVVLRIYDSSLTDEPVSN